MKFLTKQSILVMGWAVVGSQIVTAAIVQSFAPDLLGVALKISPIVSAIVAAPITYLFFRQNVELAKANKELAVANSVLGRETALAKREASLDPMTSVFNRVHFVKEIEERRSTDTSEGFFLMLDADNFKSINDTFGHVVGDAVLIRITQVMKMTMRDDDIVGRLGGEEFGIYLRGVTRKQAYDVAERIRSRVASTKIEADEETKVNVTVSIGAVFAAKKHNVTQLMQLADRNLYAAKNNGRNMVVFDALNNADEIYTPDNVRIAS